MESEKSDESDNYSAEIYHIRTLALSVGALQADIPSFHEMTVTQRIFALLRRIGALAYDLMTVAALIFIAGAAVVVPVGMIWGSETLIGDHLLFRLYLAAVFLGFFGGFWTHGGQTLGLRAWKLRLVRADGGPVGWKQAAARMAAAIPSVGLLGLGYLWILVDRDGLAWHDRLSGTHIVSSRE